MVRWVRGLVGIAGCVVLILTACGEQPAPHPNTPPPKTPWTGPLAQLRAVWSAESGIDLLTGPAVVVRAYLESYKVAILMGDDGYVYPGFMDAVAPNTPDDGRPDSTQFRRPVPREPVPRPLVGSERMHILRLDTSGNRVTAVVCDWSSYTAAWDLGDGKYGYPDQNAYPDDGVDMYWIAMTVPAGGGPPLPPQQGPALAPVDDVFGGWRIDGNLHGSGRPPWEEWPSQESDFQACSDNAPEALERREFLRRGEHPRADYPTLPAYPGWPSANAS